MAIGRDAKTYYVNIGRNINYSDYILDEKYKLARKLRDRIASLKWEIIEQMPSLSRAELPNTYYTDFIGQIMERQVATYSIQDVIDTMFHPKEFTHPSEAFSHLCQIEIGTHNAFLAKQRHIYIQEYSTKQCAIPRNNYIRK